MSCNASLTERLQLFMQGDSTVADALLCEVLPKLRESASRELKRERYMAPLSKTELVHEVWISALSQASGMFGTAGISTPWSAWPCVGFTWPAGGSRWGGAAPKRRSRSTKPAL